MSCFSPPFFWPYALNTATYLFNILPSKLLGNLTPTHLLYSKPPSYTHFWIFGCLCFPLIPSTKIHKLQSRSSPCVFLGYPSSHRGYRCYELTTHKIIISRHVVFDEFNFPFSNFSTYTTQAYDFLDSSYPSLLLQT